MELYVKILLLPYFLFYFWFSNMTLPDALISPVSQLQTQQLMTPQIRSHMSYRLIISLCSSLVEIDEKCSYNGEC